MDCAPEFKDAKKVMAGTDLSGFVRFMTTIAVIIAISLPAIAQNGDLQQKLAAVKQAAAENKQRLHQYQWIETTQLTLKGDPKPSSQKLCQYLHGENEGFGDDASPDGQSTGWYQLCGADDS